EAEPGTLAVSDATWRLVRGYFRAKSMGERRLKGLAEPLRLWSVTGATGAESRLGVGGLLTRFVGRRRERGGGEALWAEGNAAGARFVTLRGEPGIGKSRLIQEFTRGGPGAAADVLVARCSPYSQNTALLPIVELVSSRLGLDSSDTAEARLERIEERLL